MADLIIKNKIINAPIDVILKKLREETGNHYFRQILNKGNNWSVTCPFHKNGQESHPSCQVYCGDSSDVEYGVFHCFTCGTTSPLYTVVGYCFGKDDEFGKDWLIDNFGTLVFTVNETIDDITIPNITKSVLDRCKYKDSYLPQDRYLDESILQQYNYYHEYMWKRKLSKDIVDLFEVGYNPKEECITFPVRDEKGGLKLITQRSVKTKYFYIQEDSEKPIYLLYYILKNNIINNVWVCESQINCLYLWSLGIPAIALFGTGSAYQYNLLNKTGIRSYTLAFDGDDAGDKGTQRFLSNIRKDVLVNIAKLPRGKDVNDLTPEQIQNLEII
jgi:DNA primase